MFLGKTLSLNEVSTILGKSSLTSNFLISRILYFTSLILLPFTYPFFIICDSIKPLSYP